MPQARPARLPQGFMLSVLVSRAKLNCIACISRTLCVRGEREAGLRHLYVDCVLCVCVLCVPVLLPKECKYTQKEHAGVHHNISGISWDINDFWKSCENDFFRIYGSS